MALVQIVALAVILAWTTAGVVLSINKRHSLAEAVVEVVTRVWSGFRPLYLPAVGTNVACSLADGDEPAGTAIMLVVHLLAWWVYKDLGDHDDRWKRRQEKLAARVAQVGGRLTVVPATGGA